MLTGAETKLFARAARDGLAALPEERHLHRRFAVDGCASSRGSSLHPGSVYTIAARFDAVTSVPGTPT